MSMFENPLLNILRRLMESFLIQDFVKEKVREAKKANRVVLAKRVSYGLLLDHSDHACFQFSCIYRQGKPAKRCWKK